MKNVLLLSVFTILFLSCKKRDCDHQIVVDCNKLTTALWHHDSEQVNVEVNKLTSDLLPNPTNDDKIGHSKNLDVLVDRLESNCEGMTVTLRCYACIETYPAQSEIIVRLDSLGKQIERIIDISTPEDDILKALQVH